MPRRSVIKLAQRHMLRNPANPRERNLMRAALVAVIFTASPATSNSEKKSATTAAEVIHDYMLFSLLRRLLCARKEQEHYADQRTRARYAGEQESNKPVHVMLLGRGQTLQKTRQAALIWRAS
jgi:hypothetical protein